MEWMEKTLESERAEWAGQRAPEVESHSTAYHTHAPVIIFQMIDQNLQVRQTIFLYCMTREKENKNKLGNR